MHHKTPLLSRDEENPAAPDAPTPDDVELQTRQIEARFQWRLLLLLLLPIGITVLMAYQRASELGPVSFALHPIGELTALALMVTAVLASRVELPEHNWKQNALSVGSWLSATFGFYVVFTLKQKYKKPHFLTPHSHLGMLTFLSIMMYTLLSLVTFNPRTANRRYSQKAEQMHVNMGKIIVVLGLLTASAGILELERQTFPNAVAWIGTLTGFVPFLM